MNQVEFKEKTQLPFKMEVLIEIVHGKKKEDITLIFIGTVEDGFKLFVVHDNNAYYVVNNTNDRPSLFKSLNSMKNTVKKLGFSQFEVVLSEVEEK